MKKFRRPTSPPTSPSSTRTRATPTSDDASSSWPRWPSRTGWHIALPGIRRSRRCYRDRRRPWHLTVSQVFCSNSSEISFLHYEKMTFPPANHQHLLQHEWLECTYVFHMVLIIMYMYMILISKCLHDYVLL